MLKGDETESVLATQILGLGKQAMDALATNAPLIFDINAMTDIGLVTLSRIVGERKLGSIELPDNKPLILIVKNSDEAISSIKSLPSMKKLDTIEQLLETL